MKSIVLGLGAAALALAEAGAALAQSPVLPSPPSTPTVAPRQYVRHPVADRLIFERAVVRAQEREARMEWRRWTGQSPQRPSVRIGHYSSDLNQHIWQPGYGYYTGPVVFGR